MRVRRRIITLLTITLTTAFAGSLVFAGSAAAVDLEPFVQFIDHGIAPKADDIASRLEHVNTDAASSEALNYFDRSDIEAGNRHLLGFDPENDAPTPAEIRNDADWCMWLALGQSATQISDGDTTDANGNELSPGQILFNRVSPCLQSHISDAPSDQITLLSNTLVYLNEVQLVQSQSGLDPQSASNWLQENGLAYDSTTWTNWFDYSAQQVPPAT